MSTENIKSIVQEKYGEAAKRAASGQASACCGSSPASAIEGCDPITANLYGENEAGSVPEAALRASLGCGNPTALAKLAPGEIVLDLGSGGGIDVLLSARRVGPTGKAYGLDMTDEMLTLAEENKRKSGLTNVEFLKGEIENIPLPGQLRGRHRVQLCDQSLRRQGPRSARSIPRTQTWRPFRDFRRGSSRRSPGQIRKSMELWVGCVAGALTDTEYQQKLAAAGFESIDIEPTRIYSIDDAKEFLNAAGIDADAVAPQIRDKFVSAFVRAQKPTAKTCCGPTCCAN